MSPPPQKGLGVFFSISTMSRGLDFCVSQAKSLFFRMKSDEQLAESFLADFKISDFPESRELIKPCGRVRLKIAFFRRQSTAGSSTSREQRTTELAAPLAVHRISARSR